MRFLIVIFIALLAAQIVCGQTGDFYDRILEDLDCMYCAQIALDVESAEYRGRVTIDNGELYIFLNKTKGLDKKAYRGFVKKLLVNREKLRLDDAVFSDTKETIWVEKNSSIRFETVRPSKEVEDLAAKGKEEFIKRYFTKSGGFFVIKRGLEDWNPIIDKLFGWRIATYIDDETGLLSIDADRSPGLSD